MIYLRTDVDLNGNICYNYDTSNLGKLNMRKFIGSIIGCTLLLCLILTGCNQNLSSVIKNGIEYRKVTSVSDGISTECYYVVGCDSKTEILNIASEINGLPVLGFGRDAFRDNTTLKEVTIPNTITRISLNEAPFYGCSNIEKLTTAISNIENLFKTYGSSDNNNTDPLPHSLKYIYLTNGCTTIDSRSFRYCRYLQEIHIPSSVTKIEDGTGRITIGVNGNTPDNDKFDELPFLGCINLTIYCEVNVAPDGWGEYWNYIDPFTQADVVWNSYGNSQSASK